MVKCWNCQHLITAFSGEPSGGRLFEKELHRCKIKGIKFEKYYEIREKIECEDYKETKRFLKI